MLSFFKAKKPAYFVHPTKDFHACRILPAICREFTENDRAQYAARLASVRAELGENNVVENCVRDKRFQVESLLLKPVQPSKYTIIYCRGNGEFMQDCVNEMLNDVQRTGCNVLAFNYPAVAGSQPMMLDTSVLVDCVKAVVNDVVKRQKIKFNRILLKGHSLGAALATLAASDFHAKKNRLYCFNGRSFSDLVNFLEYHLGISFAESQYLHFPEKWQMQVREAYLSIPAEYRTLVAAMHDPVIPLVISLYQQVAEAGQADAKQLFVGHSTTINTHAVLLSALHNSEQSAEDVFLSFVSRSFSIELPNHSPTETRSHTP